MVAVESAAGAAAAARGPHPPPLFFTGLGRNGSKAAFKVELVAAAGRRSQAVGYGRDGLGDFTVDGVWPNDEGSKGADAPAGAAVSPDAAAADAAVEPAAVVAAATAAETSGTVVATTATTKEGIQALTLHDGPSTWELQLTWDSSTGSLAGPAIPQVATPQRSYYCPSASTSAGTSAVSFFVLLFFLPNFAFEMPWFRRCSMPSIGLNY